MSVSYKSSRLKDRREKKKRSVRPYKPLRPLSRLGCGLIIAVGAVMLFYAATLLLMRFGGTETAAAVNTRLDENGAVVSVPITSATNTLHYTYRDASGMMHGGLGSLALNTEEFGDTIPVLYFPAIPGWSILAFRTRDILTPFMCILLGVVMLYAGCSRLKEIKAKKEADAQADTEA